MSTKKAPTLGEPGLGYGVRMGLVSVWIALKFV